VGILLGLVNWQPNGLGKPAKNCLGWQNVDPPAQNTKHQPRPVGPLARFRLMKTFYLD